MTKTIVAFHNFAKSPIKSIFYNIPLWLVKHFFTWSGLLIYVFRSPWSLLRPSTKSTSLGEAEWVSRQMDHKPRRRDEGSERSTFLTSLLIATLIILAPNEKARVIKHSKAGRAVPWDNRLTASLNGFTSFTHRQKVWYLRSEEGADSCACVPQSAGGKECDWNISFTFTLTPVWNIKQSQP